MKIFKQSKSSILVAMMLLVSFSCQDFSDAEEISPIDEDMAAATLMANNYLQSIGGRQNEEKSITVLQFKDGKIVFNTNTDDELGYNVVNEETITGTAKPGEHVFWFAGGGLTDLDGIEFDEESMLKLVDAPEEAVYDKMWILTVPEDFDEEDGMLKYDIIYNFKGNDGPPIRLDPKLKVGAQ